MTTPGPVETAGLRADYLLYRVAPERSPDETYGIADVDVTSPEGGHVVAHVAFTLGPWPPVELPAGWWEPDGCDVRLDFEVPRTDPAYRDQALDLRLVAGLMAVFSVGRSVRVRVIAEERGWQSHKLARRESCVPGIMRHWSRLGFEPSGGPYSCQPGMVERVTRDYLVPPGLATWGPRFELAERSSTPLPFGMELLSGGTGG